MDGEFNVEYLGCSILAKTTTSGLGSIQKALKERYIDYRKNSKSKRQGQPVHLRVNHGGLTVVFPMSRPGEANQMFYDYPSINFFEAVRFVSTKGGDKKLMSAFLPLDPNRAPMQGPDRLFSPLEKKHHSLLKMQHPAMIACVMRRTQGIKALECHYFVTESDMDALRIVSTLESNGDMPPPPPDREEYGREGMYGGGYPPPPQDPDLVRREYGDPGSGYRPVAKNSEGWEDERLVRNNNDDNDRYMGNPPGGHNYLRQQDLFGGPQMDENGRPNRLSGELPNYRDPDRAPPLQRQNRFSSEENRMYHHERQGSGDAGGRFTEERVFHHERQRSGEGRGMHERQRSGEGRGMHERQRSGEGRGMHERQRSDDRNSLEYGRPPYEQERFSRPQDRDDHQGRIPRVLSPGRYRDPPGGGVKPSRALSPGPKSPRSPGLPRQPYVQQPKSPRFDPPKEEFYSVSNLESRQNEQKQKPIAKVPPHLIAGVKVLPTNLLAALPKKIEAEPSRYGDLEEEGPYDNAQSRTDFYARKNVKSDGHNYDGRRGDYGNEYPADYGDEYRSKPEYGGYAPPDIVPRNERGGNWDAYEKNRVGYGGDRQDDIYRKNSNRSNPGNRHSEPIIDGGSKPWSYDSEFKKFNKSSSEDQGGFDNYRGHPDELSDMFNKIGPHRVGDGGVQGNIDFQETLGYLP